MSNDRVSEIIRSAFDSANELLARRLSEPPTQEQIDLAIRQIVAIQLDVKIDDVGALRWEDNTVVGVDVLVHGFVNSFECSIKVTR